MKFEQLEDTYKDDVIAKAMHGRELEYFHYQFDAINFEFLLTVEPEGAYREDVKKRLVETRQRMQNVENSYAALKAQITDEGAHQAAIERTTKKRKENEANAIRSDK